MSTAQADRGRDEPVSRPRFRIPPVEAALSIGLLLVVWMVAAEFTEPYIIPTIPATFGVMFEVLTEWDLARHALQTAWRIALGLILAFVIGTTMGLVMGAYARADRFLMPQLQIIQGIPSLSWVIISIIWFQNVELRIVFILLIITLPGFAFQALDSYRSVPKELRDMARSLRPRRMELFRTVTWPSIVPDLLTAWKVNIGLGTRVVLIAELVGASVGVGYQLLLQQQTFSMAGVIAWTGVLVLFVLLVQFLIGRVERRLLRYRPKQDGGADDAVRTKQDRPGKAAHDSTATGADRTVGL